jgi:hypothetical protein
MYSGNCTYVNAGEVAHFCGEEGMRYGNPGEMPARPLFNIPGTVVMTALSRNVDVGNPYTVSIRVIDNRRVVNVQYKMMRHDALRREGYDPPLSWYEVHSGAADFTFTRIARTPGTWNIKARVTFENNEYLDSNVVQVQELFPHINTIRNNAAIIQEMRQVWEHTKRETRRGHRQEFGFWIYAVTEGDTLTFVRGDVREGTIVTGCIGYAAQIRPGGINETLNFPRTNPLANERFAVAHFHTHTPLTFCNSDAWRSPVGPSDPDWEWTRGSGFPGLVYDYVGEENDRGEFGLRGRHNINANAKVSIFGPLRRVRSIQ